MTSLVACLSTGKGTWASVSRLLQVGSWDKVYLLTNDFGIQNFQKDAKTELLVINENVDLSVLRDQIKALLHQKLQGEMDVAVHFVSGSGKEHMALVAALIQLGVGIRLVDVGKNGLEEL